MKSTSGSEIDAPTARWKLSNAIAVFEIAPPSVFACAAAASKKTPPSEVSWRRARASSSAEIFVTSVSPVTFLMNSVIPESRKTSAAPRPDEKARTRFSPI